MDALRNSKKISLLALAILFLFTFFNLILDAPRILISQRYMSVGTGRQNIMIMFWKEQFHFWEYINVNQTFISDSHRPFICSVHGGAGAQSPLWI